MIKKPFWAISLLLAISMLVACSNTNNEEKEINDLKEQVLQFEQENLELKNKVTEYEIQLDKQVKKVFFNKSDKRNIDGCGMFIQDSKYYLEYDGQMFISTQFIKDIFGINMDDQYGVVIKGFPCEEYIIKTDSMIKVQDIVDDLGLEEKFEKQVEEGNYYYNIEEEVNGLRIEYGEVGISKYIFTDSTYSTERGITIGSTKNDVKKAYGQLGSMNAEIWNTFLDNVEYHEGNAFKFAFDENDIVTGVSYGWQ